MLDGEDLNYLDNLLVDRWNKIENKDNALQLDSEVRLYHLLEQSRIEQIRKWIELQLKLRFWENGGIK